MMRKWTMARARMQTTRSKWVSRPKTDDEILDDMQKLESDAYRWISEGCPPIPPPGGYTDEDREQ